MLTLLMGTDIFLNVIPQAEYWLVLLILGISVNTSVIFQTDLIFAHIILFVRIE